MHPGFCAKDRYKQADSLYVRAIDIHEKALGPDHPAVAVDLCNRATLLQRQVRV